MKIVFYSSILNVLLALNTVVYADVLSLQEAIDIALKHDHIVEQHVSMQKERLESAVAEFELPNPVVKIGFKNLPVQSFDFNQEAMTQTTLEIDQKFPPKNSRRIKRSILENQAQQWAASVALRRLRTIQRVQELWLDIYYWKESIASLQKDKILFEQVLSITRSLYSVGRKQQHDLVRAELEVSRLQERIIQANAKHHQSQYQMSRWIDEAAFRMWPKSLEDIPRIPALKSKETLAKSMNNHPSLEKLKYRIDEDVQQVALAEQDYKPVWELQVSYGYRGNDSLNNIDRDDLFSVIASVQLPLFGAKKQDNALNAKKHTLEAEKLGYLDSVKMHHTAVQKEYVNLMELDSRISLYQETILEQSARMAATTLTAYESDTAEFAELMRAYLSDQKTHLDYLQILVDQQRAVGTLYFLLGVELPGLQINKGAETDE